MLCTHHALHFVDTVIVFDNLQGSWATVAWSSKILVCLCVGSHG